jgi:hypothetical protein
MAFCIDVEGTARGQGRVHHGRSAIKTWLCGLGATEVPDDSTLLRLPDSIRTPNDVRAFVQQPQAGSAITDAAQRHLHSLSLDVFSTLGSEYPFAWFNDMLTDEEWLEEQRQRERRFAVAQFSHEGQLPRELAAIIAHHIS